jgi:hypothetical protein
MKAIVTKVIAKGPSEGKFGTKYDFTIGYKEADGSDRMGYYSSKKAEQNTFIEGKECEFTEEERTSKQGNVYYIVKPMYAQPKSGYGQNVKREQARYSGFAVSYVKDMIVAGHVPPADWHDKSKEVFSWMVAMDKEVKS